jgi:hypothetical protein
MIDWGTVAPGSVATVYIPGLAASEIMLLAARKYRSHRLARIDEHTLKMATGGITYLPIPFTDASLPGLITVDLPEGVKRGQAFTIVVRQVTGSPEPLQRAPTRGRPPGVRHVVGSFQLTIPVRDKAEMLPGQQRLLSVLRWIERAIPAGNRWAPVFGRYVAQIAERVDALGGSSRRVAPSPSGQWQQAYWNCLLLMILTMTLLAALVAGAGTQPGMVMIVGGLPLLALLTSVVVLWRKTCRPTLCRLLTALIAGSAIGALILVVLLVVRQATPQLVGALVGGAGIAAVAAIVAWRKRCF